MAIRFGSPGASAFGSNAGGSSNTSTVGPELEEIQTEALGFQSIAGEAKLQLLPTPWPADSLPPTTASLLSVASQNGILAAAGPNSVVVAKTEAVRKAFGTNDGADSSVKAFTPQLTLDLGIRISQVAFAADEKYLVLSVEDGGGLAVYDVQSLMQGNTQTAFEISTNGASLRTLLPNPTPERAELFAVVTVKGQLLMANLASQQLVNGPQGTVLKEGVSCVSWSARGKQIIAGLGDGSCFQLTPEGEGKNSIPPPPNMEVDQHVSALAWLENELFLVGHTTTSGDEGMIPETVFRLVTRQSGSPNSHTFQKLPDPAPPYGMMTRCPPHHFMQRLRNFPPSLSDLIVVTSTASTDVGLFTRADKALTSDAEEDRVTKVFTTTTMADDTRRAQLPIPMTEESSDTSPIGMALDLSSTEKVPRPLPGEEMDESTGPLPLLMILNNEGLLTSWWVVYAESIRQGTTYPGLVAAGGFQTQTQKVQTTSPFTTSTTQPTSSPFTSSAFGNPPAQNNAFPKPAASSTFSSTGMNSAFGASSALGSKTSIWGSSQATGGASQTTGSTFGKPAFGSSSQIGGTFGAPSDIGSRSSPWGAPSAVAQTGGSAFGQTANLGMGTFGSNVSKPFSTESSSGFASFARKPGFAEAAAAAKPNTASPFATPGDGKPFSSGMDTDTIFKSTPRKPEETTSSLFGSGSMGGQFKLGSTFKGDGTSSTDGPKPPASTNNSLFGVDFSNTLGEAQKPPNAPISKEADMDEGGSEDEHEAMSEASVDDQGSATPAAKPKSSIFNFQQTAPPMNGGLFGTQAQGNITPAMVQNSAPAAALSSESPLMSTTPEDTPRKSEDIVRPSIETTDQPIKTEPQDDSPLGISKDVPARPLPPDTTSKDSYSPGDTSQSSASDSKRTSGDAPLPPDFLPSRVHQQTPEPDPVPEEKTALPQEEDSDLDDEGSGVDVAQEISPTTDPTRTPKITPGSSFGAPLDKSPDSLFSSKGQPRPHGQPNALFGEIKMSSHMRFPPPSKTQESPRSPSPIRSHLAVENLRPDNARSISAPSASVKSLSGRSFGAQASNPLAEPPPSIEELQRREQERLHAQRARRVPEEPQDPTDEQDDQIAELLSAELEPTTGLAEFIAQEDYHPDESKPGLPGQIENLYRDINSMINTIGLNARNLEAFARGHSELFDRGDRTIDELEEPGWCLGEVDKLMSIEDKILAQVESNAVSDIKTKLAECEDLRKDLKRLRDRQRDVSSVLASRSDQRQADDLRYAQLPVDQAQKQKELRSSFKRIQELTAEAERKVFELRTDLASQESTNNHNGRSTTKKPTVEAVVNTIQKMTSMVQQRSADIDVLESQMRKLRIPAAAGVNGGSRENSPFAASSTLLPSDAADSLSRSLSGMKLSVHGNGIGSVNGTPQKQRLRGVTPEQVSRYQAKIKRRKEINALVKQVWRSEKPVVRALD